MSENLTYAALGVACLAVLAILSMVEDAPRTQNTEARERGLLRDAHWRCQQYVEQRLRAPATARFASYGDSLSEMVWSAEVRVVSHVDAENAFGALIRTYYDCRLRPGPDGSSFELISLDTE